MKVILKTSNGTIVERAERCDEHLDADVLQDKVVDILIAALAANGMMLCGDSDIKWKLFEFHMTARLRKMRDSM